jgi:hypothetical protein
VGADVSVVEEGDEVLWYYATFGETGGPQTLDLARSGRSCFRAFLVDDTCASERATAVVFLLDGRHRASANGRFCPTGHWHTLRATKTGAIISEAVGPR